MAQVIRCDLCGKTEDTANAPKGWGYVFRPLSHAVPAAEYAAHQARQKKDLCEGCSDALDKILNELRSRLQRMAEVEVSRHRHEVVTGLLEKGHREPDPR